MFETTDIGTVLLSPTFRIRCTWTDLAVANEDNVIAQAIQLDLDGPNPFTDRTTLTFSLDAPTEVSVVVYDVLGRVAVTLADEAFAAGPHRVAFDAASLPVGVIYGTASNGGWPLYPDGHACTLIESTKPGQRGPRRSPHEDHLYAPALR